MSLSNNSVLVPRLASGIGGVALLLIAILAAVGNFGALSPLTTIGDAAKTVHDTTNLETLFRIEVLCMMGAAILDVVLKAIRRPRVGVA